MLKHLCYDTLMAIINDLTERLQVMEGEVVEDGHHFNRIVEENNQLKKQVEELKFRLDQSLARQAQIPVVDNHSRNVLDGIFKDNYSKLSPEQMVTATRGMATVAKIWTIKLYRDTFGVDLRTAKEYVEKCMYDE